MEARERWSRTMRAGGGPWYDDRSRTVTEAARANRANRALGVWGSGGFPPQERRRTKNQKNQLPKDASKRLKNCRIHQ
jgi:hypothetical protein